MGADCAGIAHPIGAQLSSTFPKLDRAPFDTCNAVYMSSLKQRILAVDEQASGFVIGGVRILAGLLWLANIHWKVPGDFGENNGGGLYKYSASTLRHATFGPFKWLTEHLILPNFTFFGWFTLISEISLALLLLAGYRTKLVALAGAAMSVPILLSVLYYDKTYEWSWSYLLMIGLHLLLYATNAGTHLGLDGVLSRGAGAARRSLRSVGIVATVVGVLGLFVARSIRFAGSKAALLGSDAGYVADDGTLQRRWELKFLWFNPLWALLTIAFGVLLILGIKQVLLAVIGAAGFAAMAVVVFVTKTFDYARDDGAIQKVATGSNVAVWGAFALCGLLMARASGADTDVSSRSIDAGAVKPE